MSTLYVVRTRMEALAAFFSMPRTTTWATLGSMATTQRFGTPVPVVTWERTVTADGITDESRLLLEAPAGAVYDSWCLAISADAEPFLWAELGSVQQVAYPTVVEITARLTYFPTVDNL